MIGELAGGRPVPRGWQVVVGLVAAVLLVVGVGLLIARAAGFSEVREAVEAADSTWFAACLAAEILALVAYADVVREAFRRGGGPDPGSLLSGAVMLASVGTTRVFAAAGAGALAVTYWCFRRAGFPVDEALVRVLGFNLLFYVSFGIGAWLAALLAVTGVWGDQSLALTLPWLLLVPLCFLVAGFATREHEPRRATTASGSFVRRAIGYAVAATAWVRAALLDPTARRMLASSVLYWVANVACRWASLRAVGVSLPLPELVLAFALGQVAMIVPLPLGGVGGVDAAMTYALTAVGVPLAVALVAVGVYRLFAFWAPTIPALVALVLLPRTGDRLSGLLRVDPSLR